jgi:hypothetical protein
MLRYRIVKLIHDSGSSDRRIEWVIQSKSFWGWKEIMNNQGPKVERVSHDSYKKAELYLFENYTGHGICQRYGSEYTFEYYTYGF